MGNTSGFQHIQPALCLKSINKLLLYVSVFIQLRTLLIHSHSSDTSTIHSNPKCLQMHAIKIVSQAQSKSQEQCSASPVHQLPPWGKHQEACWVGTTAG